MKFLHQLLVKVRVFRRRRQKHVVTVALLVAVVVLFVTLQRADQENVDLITHPDPKRWWKAAMKVFEEKTVPFHDTPAHSYEEEKEDTAEAAAAAERKARLRMVLDADNQFDPTHERLQLGYRFFNDVFRILYRGKPQIPRLERYLSDERIYHARYDTKNEDERPFTEEYLLKFLQLAPGELESMKQSHQYVKKHLPEHAPDNLYKGNGIVYVGGGKFNWLTLLSIKSIRALGLTLPIEVLIPELDEYEPDLCARVFPALDARCIYLPRALSNDGTSYVNRFQFKGFQYKALAILVSSFENVLLLDSDNIPVHPPDQLFDTEPFTSHGLIVWPDFWKRATSPEYYAIAGIDVSKDALLPKYNEVTGMYDNVEWVGQLDWQSQPLHQRRGAIPDPSSELGQLMISKKTHTKALLLALYYNLYGPTHFYPLFSQGSDGEGDKETFLAATVALDKPFYQVAKFLNAFGYFDSDNEFQGTGMGQYDPREDYYVVMRRTELKDSNDFDAAVQRDDLLRLGPHIMFVHANYPKLNPWDLKVLGLIFNKDGERIRLYGTGMRQRTGYDFETVQWTNMKFLLCDLKISLAVFKDVDRDTLCAEISTHLAFLKHTINTLE